MELYRTKSVWMQELSWLDIKEAMEHGYDTVFVGFGATEQHGPHLPIFTDTLTASGLCGLAALYFDNVLVAPTLTAGSSIIHRFFPGTFNMDTDILYEYVKEYCMCLIKQGFKHVFLVPTHGGNFSTVERVEEYFSETKYHICSAYPCGDFIQCLRNMTDELKIPRNIAGTHSGEMETAIYMYLTGDLSVMNRAETGFLGNYDEERQKGIEKGMAYLSPSGIIGDAKQASYANGKYYVDGIVSFIVENVQERLK